MTNIIVEYNKYINKNKDIVCNKIKKVYAHLEVLTKNKKSEWEFDESKYIHALTFIEKYCKHSKGKFGGQPLLLELWQKALIGAMFGIVHKIDGTRKYQQVMLIVARKNGKSVLSSAIGLYLMIADGEPGAEIYACATKRDQAKIIWLEAKRMVKKSPVLLKRIKPLVAEMVSDYNDSTFKPLGSDSETQDGLNVHGALLDEIHAWKTKDLYDVIVDGTTARDEPLTFITSTAGTIRESIYDILYDEAELIINGLDDEDGYKNERFLPIIYELDNRKEWTDINNSYKANPGLGTIKKTDQLQAKINKAIANPMLVKNLLCKDFNIRETSSETWLTFEQINNTNTYDLQQLKPRYGIGGADLSSTTDLTSACILFRVPDDPNFYYNHMYWLPSDLLEQRTKEDKIPYDIWHELGLLRVCEGNSVHAKYVTAWFKEMQDVHDIYLFEVGYDSWSAKYWVEEMQSEFGKECIQPVIQGKKTLSGPMKLLGVDLSSHLINYNNNPITKWCLTNTAIDVDKNDNIQPCKTSNARRRIDGTASMLNAYVRYIERQNDYLNMI